MFYLNGPKKYKFYTIHMSRNLQFEEIRLGGTHDQKEAKILESTEKCHEKRWRIEKTDLNIKVGVKSKSRKFIEQPRRKGNNKI